MERCRPCERGKQRGRKKRRRRNKRFEVGPTNHDWFESHPTHEPHVIIHAVRATGRGRWRHVRWLKAPTTLRQHHGGAVTGAPRPTVVVAQHIIVAAPGPCVREREREKTHVTLPPANPNMARGNQREISRAKNQTKIDAKKKQEGKVGLVVRSRYLVPCLCRQLSDCGISHTPYLYPTTRVAIQWPGTKVTRRPCRPNSRPKRPPRRPKATTTPPSAVHPWYPRKRRR
jgi:hypothetical protein